MLRALKILIITAIAISAAAFASGVYYYTASGPLAESTTVVFKRGIGFHGIVDELAEKNIIRSPLLFKAIAVISGDARRFKAGEYAFEMASAPKDILDMIANGRVVVRKITVPEGFTASQVIALITAETALDGPVPTTVEEGSLLPQTYHFMYGDTRAELTNRMQAGMRSELNALWAKRAEGLPLDTPQQALTLASIVEKETGVPSERGRVAAVFINRLKKGMRLQSDPTVIYGIEKNRGKPLGRALLSGDLDDPSPYNTYQVVGLPPGPIANPGRDALAAVLNPPQTNELYFVATGDGGHNFAATLDEHNKNVKIYRARIAQKEKPEKM